MDQERIGKLIKKVRNKANLSQEKFGEKYGVTYQAVSKWENGKNLPDISILSAICKDYNLDINEFLNNSKKKRKISFLIIILLVILIVALIIVIPRLKNNKDSFEFKRLETACENFELSGSIAYDKSKTSIYISNITYCGKNIDTKYQEIECNFYEQEGSTKTLIDSYKYKGKEINLEEFLKDVKFNVDHYSKTCSMYKENALHLEIKAKDSNEEVTVYDIPLKLVDNCA